MTAPSPHYCDPDERYFVSDGHDRWVVWARDPEAALDVAESELRGDPAWDDLAATACVTLRAWRGRGPDLARRLVTIDPPEPMCSEDEHDWRQVEAVGHGGGCVRHDRCRHCGAERRIDTWAGDPGTGVFRAVSYS